ncbi:MAG: hypothetical protein ACK4Z0_08030 [Sphingomonadaceae bacterium]
MPIRKPKPVKMPMPFPALELSEDDAQRRRALIMKRELERTEGFSWTTPRPSLAARIAATPIQQWLAGLAALGMAVLVVAGFLVGMDAGVEIKPRILFVESWSAERSAEDAIADRAEAMARLEAAIEANRARLEAAEQARATEAGPTP